MMDVNKRKVLKCIAGATAVVAMPSVSSAHFSFGAHKHSQEATTPTVETRHNFAELSVSIVSDKVSTLTMTNTSAHPITVKHIHPGLIHAGEKTFDINSIFSNGAWTIEPGTSREVAVNTITGTQNQATFPRHLYRKMPQRAVSVTGRDKHGQFVNSTRSFYA